MFSRESSIEKIIRDNVPSFVIGTSHLVEKFHSYRLWDGNVQYLEGHGVIKPLYDNINMTMYKKEFLVAQPDFILNDSAQMRQFNRALYNAEEGLPYSNPFRRKNGWYIEVLGDYWHDFSSIGISKEEHERQMRHAYEYSGNHVLILWEHDILNHWQEYCKPAIDKYIADFVDKNNVDNEWYLYKEPVGALSGNALACLNEDGFYLSLSESDRNSVLDELVNKYSLIKPLYDENGVRSDWLSWKEKCETKNIKTGSVCGNVLLNYFIRSRFEARVKGKQSINEIWANKELMRHCIQWQLSNETGLEHANRFLAAMEYRQGFRVVSNLNQSYVYLRCKNYAVKDGIFFDPCAGWGGRLLGAYALGMKYVAIDANAKLVEELKQMASYIGYDAEIYCGDSSNAEFVKSVLNGRTIDLSFTCPPYFNEEHYSDDKFQSDAMFTTNESWHKNFLWKMIDNVKNNLTENGTFILSFDDKIDMTLIDGVNFQKLVYPGFNQNREDPYYLIGGVEQNENDDYVKCCLCGECMHQLHNHIVKVHKITLEKYQELFPDNEISSRSSFMAKSNANKKKYDGIENHHYNKRFVYLMPDGTYASKSDKYKRAWGFDEIKQEHIIDASTIDYVPDYAKSITGVEGEDYVVCAICGAHKGSLTQHLRKIHHMTSEEYQARYGMPVHSKKNEEAFHNCAVNKWKTQFENGTSQHHVEKQTTGIKKADVDCDKLNALLGIGYNQADLCREFNCSDTTLRKYMVEYGVPMPSRTELAIRKAVHEGSEFDIRKFSVEEVEKMISNEGKENAMKHFGLKRTVFDSWLKENRTN